MTDITREMILDYMVRKGGVVKNVDLVRHFRKHLQLNDPFLKDQARESFKEKVNSVAYIRAEKGEKCLYLKQEFQPHLQRHPPPEHRTSAGSLDRSSLLSEPVTPISFGAPPSSRLSTPLSPPTSSPAKSNHYSAYEKHPSPAQPSRPTPFQPHAPPEVASSGQADVSLQSNRPIASSPPPPSSSSLFSPPPPTAFSSSLFSPPASTTSSSLLGDGDPESLLAQFTAELSNFGTGLFSSVGNSSLSSPPAPPVSSIEPVKPVSSSVSHAPSVAPPVISPPSSSTPPPLAPSPSSRRAAPAVPPHSSRVREDLSSSPPPVPATRPGMAAPLPAHPPSSRPPPTFSPHPPPPTSHRSPTHSSPTRRLGPTVDLPAVNGHVISPPHPLASRRQGSMDGAGRRQDSFDQTPAITVQRVNSPTRSSDSSSMGGSPLTNGTGTSVSPHTSMNLLDSMALGDPRLRSISNGSLGVAMREAKVGRAHSTAGVRRSRNLENKPSILDSITRASISMTPPTARRNKHPTTAPSVAPKPDREQAASIGSREDFGAPEGDDEGSVTAVSEGEYYDIDPLEKEWMLAAAQGHAESINRLAMTDPSLISRRDFIHGYTALHWAAKQGRCDLMALLVLSGAHVDSKSNGGFTPLHLAVLGNHENVISLLIQEYGASVNVRDHSGHKPIDFVTDKSSEVTISLLSRRLRNYGGHQKSQPALMSIPSFSQPKRRDGSLRRDWSSDGGLLDKHMPDKKHTKKHTLSPRMSIRKRFSFRARDKDKVNKTKRPHSGPANSFYET